MRCLVFGDFLLQIVKLLSVVLELRIEAGRVTELIVLSVDVLHLEQCVSVTRQSHTSDSAPQSVQCSPPWVTQIKGKIANTRLPSVGFRG